MRVLFRSSFDRWTGYGNDAVDIACAMSDLGVDVVPWATGLQAGLPSKFTRLLEKSPYEQYDAVLQFAPPYEIRPDGLAGFGGKTYGWTMWERSRMVESDFVGEKWAADKWSGLDGMFVTCPMNVAALRAVDQVTPFSVAPCGVSEFPLLERKDRRIRFLMVGMLAGRKDPFLLLDAWRELKQEVPEFDAELTLKTACPGLHPSIADVYPDVRVISAVWPPEMMTALYGEHDVMVSVSRGEGNNKPAMEFMATGGPVMASNWSGHRNWLHEDWTYPLSGTLVDSGHGWSDFRVDKEHLKERLLECWRDRQRVQEKGRIARGVMLSRFSWKTVVGKVLMSLN